MHVALGRFPVKLDLVMASVVPFSIVWVTSQITGHKLSKVEFLRVAMNEKIGNPNRITTGGKELRISERSFPKRISVLQGFCGKSSFEC